MRAGEPILGLTLREHIGGRWAISLWAYALNAPLNLLSVSSNADATGESPSFGSWALAWLLSYAAMGGVLLIANFTVFRDRRQRPLPIWSVVILGAMAGGVRGFLIGSLAQNWGLAPSGANLVLTRVLTGMVLGAVLLPLADLTLSLVDSYRRQRMLLIEEQKSMRANALRATGNTEQIREALVDSVRVDIELLEKTQDPTVARDVGHRIWHAEEEVSAPRLSWRTILVASVAHNPFPTVPVVLIWCAGSAGALIATLGLTRAMLQLAWSAACIAVCFGVGRRARGRISDPVLFTLVMVAAVVLTGPAATVLFDPRPWPAGAGLVIANTIWLPLLTILVGVVVAAVRFSEDVLNTLRDRVSEEELLLLAANSENERVRRELATTLHGSVQTRLLAAAGLAQQPGFLPPDFVRGLNDALLRVGSDGSGLSLHEQVQAMTRQWAALMEVDVQFVGDVETGIDADATSRVIEDALTNSYRHGGASRVLCRVDGSGAEVVVTLTDDGSPKSPTQVPGLGSKILDAVAPRAWQRVTTATGTTLTVQLTRSQAATR